MDRWLDIDFFISSFVSLKDAVGRTLKVLICIRLTGKAEGGLNCSISILEEYFPVLNRCCNGVSGFLYATLSLS